MGQTVPRKSNCFLYEAQQWYKDFRKRRDSKAMNRENEAMRVFGILDHHHKGIISVTDFVEGMRTRLGCEWSDNRIRHLFYDIQQKSESVLLPAQSDHIEHHISQNAFMCLMLTENQQRTWQLLCSVIERAIKSMRKPDGDQSTKRHRPRNTQTYSSSSTRAIAPPLPQASTSNEMTQAKSASRSKLKSHYKRDSHLQSRQSGSLPEFDIDAISDASPDMMRYCEVVSDALMSDQNLDILMQPRADLDHSTRQSPRRQHEYQSQTQFAPSEQQLMDGQEHSLVRCNDRQRGSSNPLRTVTNPISRHPSNVRGHPNGQTQSTPPTSSEATQAMSSWRSQHKSHSKNFRRSFITTAPSNSLTPLNHTQSNSRRDVPPQMNRSARDLARPNAKRLIGERLFPKVQAVEPDFAPKITGMLLEDTQCASVLLSDQSALMSKISDAMAVLKHCRRQIVEQRTQQIDVRNMLFKISRYPGFVNWMMRTYTVEAICCMSEETKVKLADKYLDQENPTQ